MRVYLFLATKPSFRKVRVGPLIQLDNPWFNIFFVRIGFNLEYY